MGDGGVPTEEASKLIEPESTENLDFFNLFYRHYHAVNNRMNGSISKEGEAAEKERNIEQASNKLLGELRSSSTDNEKHEVMLRMYEGLEKAAKPANANPNTSSWQRNVEHEVIERALFKSVSLLPNKDSQK